MTPPPGGWPAGIPSPAHKWADPVAAEKTQKEIELLKSQLIQKEEHNRTLQAQLESLKTSSSSIDVEATIVASESKNITSPSSGELSE